MEFSFDVNELLPNKITKIGKSLLPEGVFRDQPGSWDCVTKISEILDDMGKASAESQGLQKVVTSGDEMQNVDYTVYILVDPTGADGKGIVAGMLKVGRKKLFVFDSSGARKEVEALCILDFYVHESMQRKGLGKELFDHMLKEEDVQPKHVAINQPSEKLLGFLLKHYGLHNTVPQNNNFVVYDDFFNDNPDIPPRGRHACSQMDKGSASGLIINQTVEAVGSAGSQPFFGRHAAHKHESTMGQILQNDPPYGELKSVTGNGVEQENLNSGETVCLPESSPNLYRDSQRCEQEHSKLW